MPNLIYDSMKFGERPSRAVVALHGWQGDKDSLKQIAQSLKLDNTEWFFPDAPYLEDGDPKRRSWSFELYPGQWEMEEGRKLVQQLFNEIVLQKYHSENVFAFGFSQGALVCYEYVLQLENPLAGIFPVAGFLHDPHTDRPRFHPSQHDTVILIGHGRQDDTVPVEASEKAFRQLKEQGARAELLIYNGKHKIGIEYMREMKKRITHHPVRSNPQDQPSSSII